MRTSETVRCQPPPPRSEAEEPFRQLMAHLRQVFWIKNRADDAVIYISPAYATICGRSCQSLYDDYQSFVDAVGPIPTQPDATLNTKIGEELAPYLDNFELGFVVVWTQPKGMGTFGAPPLVNMFQPFGTFDDPQAAAEQAQSDLDSGLDAIR